MSENLAKFVTIIESSVANDAAENPPDVASESAGDTRINATISTPLVNLPPRRPLEDYEIFVDEPTFTSRFIRYIMVGVYLCGLCSLGFVLSIYHFFFWDSRMPPVHKSMILKKPPMMG